MKSPLLDKQLLNDLDKENQREVYAKIINLTTDELPIEEITGIITQGTLSIDGSSSVRRTCSLSLVAERLNINEYYWNFATKFKLLVGLKMPKTLREKYIENSTLVVDSKTGELILNGKVVYLYEDYPDIIWFKQGIFLITSFKYIVNTNGTDNIYITGKDKMALLNGDLGGNFMHATDVGSIEERIYEGGDPNPKDIIKTPLTMKQIIIELIHKYANEPMHNIIVNDLDDNGLIMLDYHGDNDIYLFKNVNTGLFENVIFDGDVIRYDRYNNPVILSNLEENELDSLFDSGINLNPKRLKNSNSLLDNTFYTIVKCSYGSIVGYRTTDWTYPSEGGELIMNAGDTISMALDNLCKVFDNEYEYFYDIDGRFIFQRKITYINVSQSNLLDTITLNKITNDLEKTNYIESDKLISQLSYNFIDGTMATTFNNSPNITNIKNDYAIWGKKKANLKGKENAIHLRCAIDEKPEKYKNFDGITFLSSQYDWRELIYQMALDYYNHNHDDDYEVVLSRNNPEYLFGKTGYEQYYEDLLGFWRLLYYVPKDSDLSDIESDELKQQLKKDFYLNINEFSTIEEYNKKKFWNRAIITDPSSLLFWFDFIDGKTSELSKYSVKAIGDRTKVVNNDKIRAITYGEIPNLIYINQNDYNELRKNKLIKDGYTYIILPEGMEEYFISTKKQKSTQDELDNLLFQYAYVNESITINSIPIYYLEPNTRIGVYDEKTKINGEYIINKIVITLNYNGTMQIMATKAPTRLY